MNQETYDLIKAKFGNDDSFKDQFINNPYFNRLVYMFADELSAKTKGESK
jgi:hypothetical protein